MLVYCVALLLPLVMTTDTDRVLCMFFPAIIPMALCGLEGFRKKPTVFWMLGIVTTIAVLLTGSTYYATSSWKYFVLIGLSALPCGMMFTLMQKAMKHSEYEMPLNKRIVPCFSLPTER